MRAIAGFVVVLGCAHSDVRKDPGSNGSPVCALDTREDVLLPAPSAQPGRLLFDRTDSGVTLHADAVPLSAVAIELSSVLERDVAVNDQVAHLPVSVRRVNADAEAVVWALRSRYVSIVEVEGRTFFARNTRAWAHPRDRPTQLVPLRAAAVPSFIESACAVARPGWTRLGASDEVVMVTTLPEYQASWRNLIAFVDEHSQGEGAIRCQNAAPPTAPSPRASTNWRLTVSVSRPGLVRVRAERAPLHRLVMEVAAALDLNASVDSQVVDVPVTLALNDASPATVAEVLRSMGFDVEPSPLDVRPPRPRMREAAMGALVAESEVEAQALAQWFCRPQSTVEAASTVGNVVLLRGPRRALEEAFRMRATGSRLLLPDPY
jgi:type II secretory pathway component GspD/PulD (secretin)